MCVIMAPNKVPITADMIQAAHETNGDGMGVAWRDVIDGVKVVRWKKGLTNVDEAVALVEKLTLPYIFHARRQTVGPKVPEMCHPFPVTVDVSLDLEGSTPGAVLFHNGTFKGWDDWLEKAEWLRDASLKQPVSDSRVLALLTFLINKEFLNHANEKVIWFHATEEAEVFGKDRFREANDSASIIKRWTQINGIFCSNTEFTKHLKGPGSTAVITPLRQIINQVRGKKGGSGGDRNPATGFRPGPTQLGHTGPGSPQTGENLEERLQEGSAELREGVSKGIVCVVPGIGLGRETARGPLISSTVWARAYEKAHGVPLPRLIRSHTESVYGDDNLVDPRMQIIGNVKKYRSSGQPGFAATSDEANLVRARKLADSGISKVLH